MTKKKLYKFVAKFSLFPDLLLKGFEGIHQKQKEFKNLVFLIAYQNPLTMQEIFTNE